MLATLQPGKRANWLPFLRLLEHKRTLQGDKHSQAAQHCAKCGCAPVFEDTVVIAKHKDQRVREIIEAYHMRKKAEKCVSIPSMSLAENEYVFLNGRSAQ
ncbi:hypothetical protein HPB48_012722 [Haemaphysalis longicornis]|uniref:Tick transposon n=1 Tax=Haemaphysalis longicornis TaxID=44386 RepID=A0A9J6FPQ3_HAELO|nr:hypothetical protein HPB48_012722 [Haemaphysalis longicornis]